MLKQKCSNSLLILLILKKRMVNNLIDTLENLNVNKLKKINFKNTTVLHSFELYLRIIHEL